MHFLVESSLRRDYAFSLRNIKECLYGIYSKTPIARGFEAVRC